MIYLIISILLVLAGIFLFIFSLLYSEKDLSPPPADKKINHSREVTALKEESLPSEEKSEIKAVSTLYSDTEEVVEFFDGSGISRKETPVAEALSVNEAEIAEKPEEKPAESVNLQKLKAVLYEDSSGAVDYSSLSMQSDLNADYSGIKRIGAGDFSIDDGGYNFISDKKLFRFDFHRIREIKAGSNYLAVMPSSNAPAKLFIFESEYSDIKNAAEKFSLFRKG